MTFPLTLDTDSAAYRGSLHRMYRIGEAAPRAKVQEGAVTLVKLLLIAGVPNELPANIRITPRW